MLFRNYEKKQVMFVTPQIFIRLKVNVVILCVFYFFDRGLSEGLDTEQKHNIGYLSTLCLSHAFNCI